MKKIPFKELQIGMYISVFSYHLKECVVAKVASTPEPYSKRYKPSNAYPDDTLICLVTPVSKEGLNFAKSYDNLFITDFHKNEVELIENAELLYENS